VRTGKKKKKVPEPWWVRLWESLSGGSGARGERAAARYLRKRGYRILAMNFRVPGGEADIVAEKDELLVVVEVKTRSDGGAGGALTAVTPAKARRVWVAAVAYCRKHRISVARLRLDAMAVERKGFGMRITHVPGAMGSD
jgi:putative endonuclease